MALSSNKVKLFNTVGYAVVDYESASNTIINQAEQRSSYGVFALPVHGLIEAIQNPAMREATKKAQMIVPDGQPVRWAMNYFHQAGLKDRVYGPTLTLYVLRKANEIGLNIFLYGGSTRKTLSHFANFIYRNYPNVAICGQYREERSDGNTLSSETINNSGAHIVLVGRGCPRQEIWVANKLGEVNAVMMAVGAAFSFHAGTVKQAPSWMQGVGLEWLFQLLMEPQRLWKRYLLTNGYFLYLFLKEALLSGRHEKTTF